MQVISQSACSTLSSSIKNDINILKKNVDCLGSTLSQCAINHTRLESLFRKKQISSLHAHIPRHTHAPHVYIHNTMYAHVYTRTHYGRKGHLAKFCYDKIHDVNLELNLFGLEKMLTPMDPKECGYQRPPLLYLM